MVVRGDDFVPFQGGSLFDLETRPSLWILEDDAYPRALEIAEEYARGDHGSHADSGDAWTCRWCGEEVEAQFSDCWSCGKARA